MFGRSALSSLVIALLCLAVLSAATLAEASGTVKLTAGVKKTVLANGITILVKESKANEVVAVRLALKMGAKFEGDKEAGISRLLQQSLLKGTKTRTAEQIAGEIESAGGRLEVGTGKEVGYIQLTCTAEGLEKVLDVFFDVILNPVFPGAEVNKERDLQVRRIRERKDQLLASTVDLAQEALYGSHPFHKPAEGYEETVASLGREQVLEAYGRFYRPENMVLVAVGNLDSKRFVREVEKQMGTLKRTGKSLAVELPAVALGEPRTKLVHKQSSSAWIIIAYPAPGPSQKDYAAMQVLESALGGSMHSRLFTELRDKKGLGYQVGSFYAGYSRDAFVGAYIGTKPERFDVSRDGILEEVSKVRAEGITDEELASTKMYLRGTYIIDMESNASQAGNFATNECFGVGYDFADRYLDGIGKITKGEVLKAAAANFGTYALGSILPEAAPVESGNTQGTEQK